MDTITCWKRLDSFCLWQWISTFSVSSVKTTCSTVIFIRSSLWTPIRTNLFECRDWLLKHDDTDRHANLFMAYSISYSVTEKNLDCKVLTYTFTIGNTFPLSCLRPLPTVTVSDYFITDWIHTYPACSWLDYTMHTIYQMKRLKKTDFFAILLATSEPF